MLLRIAVVVPGAAAPPYNTSWYDSIGRGVFLQLTYKLGGEGL
jgi:hypothetical protein